jgi:hypothetical protein
MPKSGVKGLLIGLNRAIWKKKEKTGMKLD